MVRPSRSRKTGSTPTRELPAAAGADTAVAAVLVVAAASAGHGPVGSTLGVETRDADETIWASTVSADGTDESSGDAAFAAVPGAATAGAVVVMAGTSAVADPRVLTPTADAIENARTRPCGDGEPVIRAAVTEAARASDGGVALGGPTRDVDAARESELAAGVGDGSDGNGLVKGLNASGEADEAGGEAAFGAGEAGAGATAVTGSGAATAATGAGVVAATGASTIHADSGVGSV